MANKFFLKLIHKINMGLYSVFNKGERIDDKKYGTSFF